MSEKAPTKIADWVKANSSVSKVAEDLKKSRPTVYKMMELYDEGKRNQLPKDVVAFFDMNIAEGEALTVIKMKASLSSKMERLSDEISLHQNKIPQILKEKAMLAKAFAAVSEELNNETDDKKKIEFECELHELRNRQLDFESRLASETVELEALKERYEECRSELARYDSSVTFTVLDNKETYPIKTTCTIEGNRCMIIHDGKTKSMEYRFFLKVYGKVGEDYVFLKEFIPKEIPEYEHDQDKEPIGYIGCNYFIIDDFLFSAPLYYKIVGYDLDDSTYDEENTSGMRPLKQSR